VFPVALGLGAATCIGVANICAGYASRRVSPLLVGFWSQATGATLCAVLLLISRPPLVAGQLVWGLLAGFAGGLGMALFYRAMAAGAISLVAPITACAVVVPVMYAIAAGETPTLLVSIGIVAIIAGVLVASMQPARIEGDLARAGVADERRVLLLAVAAAVIFGVFFILIDLAPRADGWGTLWTAGAVRLSGFSVQIALLARARKRLTGPGRLAPAIITVGALDLISLILISIGATTNAYGVVTALVGLYPVITALLGVLVLGERLTRMQASGATLAMAGVMLVSV